ncbi:MAG UNVERIFIED_CONTAM: hypothetical protein LVR18_21945 [Planctomycetaceae bacterium]
MSTPPTDYREFEEFRGRRFLFAAGHFDYFSGAEKQAVYFAGELVRHLQADVKFIGWGGDGRFANEVRKVGAVPVVFPLGSGWGRLVPSPAAVSTGTLYPTRTASRVSAAVCLDALPDNWLNLGIDRSKILLVESAG